MSKFSKKDNLRAGVIGELINADNWFTLVAGEKGVKMFTCTDPVLLKREIVTVMIQQQDFASVFIDAIGEYVRIMEKRELIKNFNLN